MLVQYDDITRETESITSGFRPYIKKIARQMTENSPEKGHILVYYVNTEIVECNIADSTREWKVKILA